VQRRRFIASGREERTIEKAVYVQKTLSLIGDIAIHHVWEMRMIFERNHFLGSITGLTILVLLTGCKPVSKSDTPAEPPRKTSDVEPPKQDLSKEGPSDPDAPEEFTTTITGLKYRILRKSNGDKPTEYSSVTISQRAWVDNGREFENSYARDAVVTAAIDKFVPGLREGVGLIGEGGKIELEVPPNLGFGAKGLQPHVPPSATLRYIIELHSFK